MMGVKIHCILCVIVLLTTSCISHIHHHQSKSLDTVLQFVDVVNSPTSCDAKDYIVIDVNAKHEKNGLANQFLSIAGDWMHAFMYGNYSTPVLIRGSIRGYTTAPECKHADREDWNCFFQDTSLCQGTLFRTGSQIKHNSHSRSHSINDTRLIPPQFRHFGLPFWWGAVLHKLFRLQPFVENHIMMQSRHMLGNRGFPFGLPLAGIHSSHADSSKSSKSLDKEITALRKSLECITKNKAGMCFSPIVLHNNHSSHALLKGIEKRQVVILENDGVSVNNYTVHKVITHADVNTSKHLLHNQLADIVHTTAITKASDIFVPYIMPMHVYVASDDSNTVTTARNLGYMTSNSVTSQRIDKKSSLHATLKSHPQYSFNVTLEILTDVYFLSQCSTLIGSPTSHTYRMAVALAYSTGNLKSAIAVDYDGSVDKARIAAEKEGQYFLETYAKA